MGVARSMCGGDERYMQGFGRKLEGNWSLRRPRRRW